MHNTPYLQASQSLGEALTNAMDMVEGIMIMVDLQASIAANPQRIQPDGIEQLAMYRMLAIKYGPVHSQKPCVQAS